VAPGELLLTSPVFKPARAEARFQKALAMTRSARQHMEPCAAKSVARLRREQGRSAEARDLLAPIDSWSPEVSPPPT
jgi:hypothetical protein